MALTNELGETLPEPRDISGTLLDWAGGPKTLTIEFIDGEFKRVHNVVRTHTHTFIGKEQPHEFHVYVDGCDQPQIYVWLNMRGYQLL